MLPWSAMVLTRSVFRGFRAFIICLISFTSSKIAFLGLIIKIFVSCISTALKNYCFCTGSSAVFGISRIAHELEQLQQLHELFTGSPLTVLTRRLAWKYKMTRVKIPAAIKITTSIEFTSRIMLGLPNIKTKK